MPQLMNPMTEEAGEGDGEKGKGGGERLFFLSMLYCLLDRIY